MADTTDIGRVAADLMEAVAMIHPEGEVGTVAVIAEIELPDGHTVRYACSDDRAWVQAGLFRQAQLIAEDHRGDQHRRDS